MARFGPNWHRYIIKRLIDDLILLTLMDFCDLDLIFKGGGAYVFSLKRHLVYVQVLWKKLLCKEVGF